MLVTLIITINVQFGLSGGVPAGSGRDGAGGMGGDGVGEAAVLPVSNQTTATGHGDHVTVRSHLAHHNAGTVPLLLESF